MRRLAIALVLLATGCLSPAAVDPAEAPALLAEAVAPSGAVARDLLHAFAMGHPNRHAGFPEDREAARAFLRDTLAAAGVEVEDEAYSATGTNILGIDRGVTKPDEWIVLSCHYDTTETTVYGARDDGLGCAALLEMARAFGAREWNRSLVYAFFDEEEDGLVGSAAFVADHLEAGDAKLAANVNFDPAGLHWPCGDALGPFPIILVLTEEKVGVVPGYAEILDAFRGAFLAEGAPESVLEVRSRMAYAEAGDAEFLPPRSDDDSFDAADVPSMWVGAPPLARLGPAAAWGYPNHTPPDTAELVEARCGSAATLEEGLRVAMSATARALAALDAT